MARFKAYLLEEPSSLSKIANDVEEIEIALTPKQKKRFIKIIRKHNKRFDKYEGWTTEDHVMNMRYSNALAMWRELQDAFQKVIKRKR